MIFSGSSARSSSVYDVTVVDASVAVAILGGNSIVYTFVPVIDADSSMVYDVTFEYVSLFIYCHVVRVEKKRSGVLTMPF